MGEKRTLRLVARLRITSKSGSVRVVAEDRADVTVEGGELSTEADGTRRVRGGSRQVEVRCPAGSDVVVGTGSGSVHMHGRLGAAKVASASGSIAAEHVAALDARTASGSVSVGTCDRDCRVVVASGSVQIGSAGGVEVAAVSGSVRAGDVGAGALKTVSGGIEVGVRDPDGRLRVHSVSGTVLITVPPGAAPSTHLRSVSGRIRCECASGARGEISAKTVSGDIEVSCR